MLIDHARSWHVPLPLGKELRLRVAWFAEAHGCFHGSDLQRKPPFGDSFTLLAYRCTSTTASAKLLILSANGSSQWTAAREFDAVYVFGRTERACRPVSAFWSRAMIVDVPRLGRAR